jgi:hypothetical protein
VAPQPVVRSSGGTTIAIIVGSIFAAIVIIAFVIIVAVAFVGRSASSQFEHVGDCVNVGGNAPSCRAYFPSP